MRLDEQTMGDEAATDQAWHQMMLEREQQAYEALADLAKGIVRQEQVEYLASYAHISSPYDRKGTA